MVVVKRLGGRGGIEAEIARPTALRDSARGRIRNALIIVDFEGHACACLGLWGWVWEAGWVRPEKKQML